MGQHGLIEMKIQRSALEKSCNGLLTTFTRLCDDLTHEIDMKLVLIFLYSEKLCDMATQYTYSVSITQTTHTSL